MDNVEDAIITDYFKQLATGQLDALAIEPAGLEVFASALAVQQSDAGKRPSSHLRLQRRRSACPQQPHTAGPMLLLFMVLIAGYCQETARASTASSASTAGEVYNLFRFDPDLCHETLSVNERGRRLLKSSGEDYQTILLSPPIPSKGRSYVEFEIINQAARQCFIGMGVCMGTHAYREGRSAMAAHNAWMLSTHSGKVYSNGGQPAQFLSGKGTPPFMPGDEHLAATSIRARQGDKVGLMADMGKRCVFVYINAQCQGAMAADLPADGLRFTVDLGDEDQQLRILDTPCPPPQPLQRHLLPVKLSLQALAGQGDAQEGEEAESGVGGLEMKEKREKESEFAINGWRRVQ